LVAALAVALSAKLGALVLARVRKWRAPLPNTIRYEHGRFVDAYISWRVPWGDEHDALAVVDPPTLGLKQAECTKKWLGDNGFNTYCEWSTRGLDLSILWAYKHKTRPDTWVVMVNSPLMADFHVEGAANYLSLLLSPLVQNLDVKEELEGIHAAARAAFMAWHGHTAPLRLGEVGLSDSCDACDPDGRQERREKRERMSRWAHEQADRQDSMAS